MSQQSSFFHFKQFSIEQHSCAMKVSTDAVLLGAWVDLTGVHHALDLGTGTGIIALMLAQRLASTGKVFHITAIEKETNAYRQAKQNFRQSPWATQLQLYQQEVGKVETKIGAYYDHVVANPPYFSPALPCRTKARHLARYCEISHLQWLHWAIPYLAPAGKISFILPFEAGVTLLNLSPLPCIRRCDVITKAGKTPRRMLLTFSFISQPLQQERLVIYDQNNTYTPAFIQLTRDFYLKM